LVFANNENYYITATYGVEARTGLSESTFDPVILYGLVCQNV